MVSRNDPAVKAIQAYLTRKYGRQFFRAQGLGDGEQTNGHDGYVIVNMAEQTDIPEGPQHTPIPQESSEHAPRLDVLAQLSIIKHPRDRAEFMQRHGFQNLTIDKDGREYAIGPDGGAYYLDSDILGQNVDFVISKSIDGASTIMSGIAGATAGGKAGAATGRLFGSRGTAIGTAVGGLSGGFVGAVAGNKGTTELRNELQRDILGRTAEEEFYPALENAGGHITGKLAKTALMNLPYGKIAGTIAGMAAGAAAKKAGKKILSDTSPYTAEDYVIRRTPVPPGFYRSQLWQ
jgi:hypothetical protein